MNDLSNMAKLVTQTVNGVKIKASNGDIVTIKVGNNNLIDLSNLSGSSGPRH